MMIFILVTLGVVLFFMLYSARLVGELTAQERERMELWADATKRIIDSDSEGGDIDFMLSVIEANRNIPVILTDDRKNVLLFRNITEEEVGKQLDDIIASGRMIPIEISKGEMQYLYYKDSDLLRKLSAFPYIETGVMVVFVLTVYFAVTATKRAEQNKVWVGLSKESAHQLGTPISSLLAWIDLMRETDSRALPDIADEMEADVKRLSDVASRFSKIGSRPTLKAEIVGDTVRHTVDYMKRRVSSEVEWTFSDDSDGAEASICRPLTEWVVECLIKNAVDGMEGKGCLTVTVGNDGETVWLEVSDSGKGIPPNKHKRIFKPGYTTKERGWGLGLTLSKRIIEEYQRGRIYVKQSAPGQGTIIRVELPALLSQGI